MDAKLARGYAREGRRKDVRTSEIVAASNTLVHTVTYIEVQVKGKVSSRRVRELAETSHYLGHNPVFSHVDHAQPGFCSSMKVQLTGSFFPTEVRFAGRLEKVSQYQVDAIFITRRSFDHRTQRMQLYLREHAVVRFIERTGARYGDIFEDLWPGVLLPTLIQLSGAGFEQEIAVPTKGGMFLGSYTPECPNAVTAVSRRGHLRGKLLDDQRLFGARDPAIWLHTFISFSEMRDNQAALWLRLTRMLTDHASTLIEWHALGASTFARTDDPTSAIKRLPCPNAAVEEFRRTRATAIWRDALRHERGDRLYPKKPWATGKGMTCLQPAVRAVALPNGWKRRPEPRPVVADPFWFRFRRTNRRSKEKMLARH